MNLFVDSIFVGFAIYSILFSIGNKWLKSLSTLTFRKIDKIACSLFSICGLLFISYSIFELVVSYFFIENAQEKHSIEVTYFGSYWILYWLYPIIHILSTQLIWVDKVKTKRLIRLIIGLFHLISFEKIVIIVTSMHRDYVTSSWNNPISVIIVNWSINLGIFALIVGLIYLLETWINGKNTSTYIK